MVLYVYQSFGPIITKLNGYIWLSTEHLTLLLPLTHKLAAKFIGSLKITYVINTIAYYIDLSSMW